MTQKKTILPSRELSCPSHSGNTHEATLPGEMTSLLAETKFRGFSRFSVTHSDSFGSHRAIDKLVL
jgi:hypothetical protein